MLKVIPVGLALLYSYLKFENFSDISKYFSLFFVTVVVVVFFFFYLFILLLENVFFIIVNSFVRNKVTLLTYFFT